MNYTASFKICIFGDVGVGKTSLTYRYITNRFIQDTKSTLGVDIVAKDFQIEGYSVKLQIWDFGGEDRFKVFLPVYARGSSGGIFIYDITRKNSLDNINTWVSIFKKNLTEDESQIPILIVGAKKDLFNHRTISIETAIDLAIEHKLYDVIECSAKTGENVEKVFSSITQTIMKNVCFI